jgi:hypothetical protein
LYAKTLALLGLGVLAGAGALVDYWPTGVTMPDAGSALARPAIARAIAVNPATLTSPAIARAARRAPRALETTMITSSAPAEHYAPVTLPVVVSADLRVGHEVGIAAPVLRTAALTSASSDPVPARMESLYEPYTLGDDDFARYPEPASLMSDDDSDGFFSGAFKKTGTSIVRTGVRTGASIVDAVRVVGGAVRKALPN